MIEKILRQREIVELPPVLVDVGAAGGIHPIWQRIAPFSIVVGFDADLRETEFVVREGSGYKKLIILNKVIGQRESSLPFYLTRSPQCSSSLEPDSNSLKPYNFKSLFQVMEIVTLQAIDLKSALAKIEVAYVDWLKIDTQGTDLTVFKSLGDNLISRVMVAEFEPGILNAYKREDKMHAVMAFMETLDFWLCRLNIKGPCRLSEEHAQAYFATVKDTIDQIHTKVPFWGEMTYLHGFTTRNSKRDLLLGCAFALILEQYGFVLELADKGRVLHKDEIFDEIRTYAVRQVNGNIPLKLRAKAFIRPLINVALYLRKLVKNIWPK